MEGSRRRFERLKDAASGEPLVFASLLQDALATEFDPSFSYLKTQKLLFRKRSSAWIADVASLMDAWLNGAPLKGKRKAQIRHHFEVCKAMQTVLSIVDHRSSTLRIWQASTEDLLQALFKWLLSHELQTHSLSQSEDYAADDSIGPLKIMQLAHMGLRTQCDYVTRIINQISLLGVNLTGNIGLTDSDIREAIAIAAVDDLLLHVVDCHTYKNFRVSIKAKQIELHPVVSKIEEALSWSSLRTRSRDIVEINPSVRIEDVERLAKTLICDSNSFGEFLDSDTGSKIFGALEPLSKENYKRLSRDAEDLIDLDLTLRLRDGTFRTDHLFHCWSLLYQVSLSSYIWQAVFGKDDVPVLSLSKLLGLVTSRVGCADEHGKELIQQFSLNPAERNQDPFFRPLVVLDGDRRMIARPFIESSRFSRNLFTIAIRESGFNFSMKGLKPLKLLHKEFSRAGYAARINLPIVDSGATVTDVDIAATKDGILFVGQTKVLINPDTVYDDWKALESLKNAARQLDVSLVHLPHVAASFGLVEGAYLAVPFILTNVWDFTGATVDGYKVVDFSYLSMLLRGGKIWKMRARPVPTREIQKLIAGKYPTGEELSLFLRRSVHEDMFQNAEVTRSSFPVEDWTVVVPIDLNKDPTGEVRERLGHDKFGLR